jgi:hypothetical protein
VKNVRECKTGTEGKKSRHKIRKRNRTAKGQKVRWKIRKKGKQKEEN